MKKIFILTGEPSGDKLASKVISKLKLIPQTTIIQQHMKNNVDSVKLTKQDII